MKAMIFAAGLGSRLKNETIDKPKALVEIGGKTLLQNAIEKLKKESINEIVVNVHHFSDKMIGGGFKFSNPNAKSSCSCGESFSI